jgi:hydroxyquinol 1,2-dioxygenase
MSAAKAEGTEHHPITEAVLARLASTPDARTHALMAALVRHLHAFARATRLTEAEWFQAVSFLTAVGQTCTDRRQEFILLSDVLGLAMLVTDQNHATPPGGTEPTVFGPFHVPGAPRFALGEDISGGAAGEPCCVPTPTAASGSGRSWPRPIRSRPTDRSAACSRPRAAIRGGPRTCTS